MAEQFERYRIMSEQVRFEPRVYELFERIDNKWVFVKQSRNKLVIERLKKKLESKEKP